MLFGGQIHAGAEKGTFYFFPKRCEDGLAVEGLASIAAVGDVVADFSNRGASRSGHAAIPPRMGKEN
jgi:hypothetical protein